VQLLRQVRQPHGLALDPLPRDRLGLAGEQPQQRGLARPVDPDETDAVAGTDAPGLVLDQRLVAGAERDVLELQHGAPEPSLGEREQLDGVPQRRHVGDQRLRGLDAVPGLRRARRGAAPQPGKLLAYEVAPLLLQRRGEPGPLGTREHPVGVAAFVLFDLPADHLPGAGADSVEKPAVVGDDDQRRASGQQVAGEPPHALDVEVVGRLVEHQQVQLLDERGGQRDATPFPTGHAGHGCVEPERGDAQPVEDRPRPRVSGPLVVGGDPERVEHGVTHRRPVRQLGTLRHDSLSELPYPADPSGVGRLDAGKDFEQGGLATTVEPDDADAVTGADAEGDAVEQRLDAVALADRLEVDQVDHGTDVTHCR
jgi:hypothetical protein